MRVLAAVWLSALLAPAFAATPAGAAKGGDYRKASYKVALKGIQVTTWRYHKDKGDDPCDFFADGEGSEEVTFEMPSSAPLVAVKTGDALSLWRQFSFKPLIVRPPSYTMSATVDRRAKTSYGGSDPNCPSRFGGGDPNPPPPDCGERRPELTLFLGFRFRDHLRLEEDATQQGLGDLELYKRCEHHGERALLLRGLGIPLPPSKLFGLKKGKRYDFNDRDEKTVSFTPGGTARTAIRYRVSLTRVSKVRTKP